jgi:hypothetical protein
MDPIHETYLPFGPDVLMRHFAPVKGDDDEKQLKRLAYYLASVSREKALRELTSPSLKEVQAGLQIQKDERFWIAASLLTLYYDDADTNGKQLFGRVMEKAGLTAPEGTESWADAFTGPLSLYFEANLNSPPSYRAWLSANLRERALIPFVRERGEAGGSLEGPTHADALLIAPETGTAVIFEAKVLSDLSTHVQFDAARNQLVRLIDVALDSNPGLQHPLTAPIPDRTYVVLLTPELLSPQGPGDAHRSRLYGWLIPAYMDPASGVLEKHLPHRTGSLAGVHSRLGWATWEDIESIRPGACSWLPSAGTAGSALLE